MASSKLPTNQKNQNPDPDLPSDDPTTKPGEGFVDTSFRLFWETHRTEEPAQYFSFRDAFQKFVDLTGLQRPAIALELSVTTSYLGLIESGKRLGNRVQYSRLKELSRSYCLPRLAEFFERWEDTAMNSQGPTRGRKVRRGLEGDGESVAGPGPNWRDAMGE